MRHFLYLLNPISKSAKDSFDTNDIRLDKINTIYVIGVEVMNLSNPQKLLISCHNNLIIGSSLESKT